MAKKQEEFRYGSSALPQGERKYSVIRWVWSGLNRTDDIDTGQISDAEGIMIDSPYVYPMKQPKKWLDFSEGMPAFYDAEHDSHMVSEATLITGNPPSHIVRPVAVFGFDQQLIVVWRDEAFNPDPTVISTAVTMVDKFHYLGNDTEFATYAGSVAVTGWDMFDTPRTVVQFNVVDTSSGNVAAYTYDKKYLLYPDCVSFPYDFTDDFTDSQPFNVLDNPIPRILYASVFQSRVFGASENSITASAFNSYVDYTLDTADDISSAHAWFSMAGSNTEANSDITAIAAHDNHVVVFRKDFMQLVYNNKNPFRIVDVGEYGCDNHRAWTIMNGVLYFASQSKVYAYAGGTPKEISKKLEIDDLSGAVLGSYKDTVWMQTKDGIYTYKNGSWSNIGNFGCENCHVEQFATLDYGIVGLVRKDSDLIGGYPTYSVWFFDWDVGAMDVIPVHPQEWVPDYSDAEWWFETDLLALGRLDIRRVKKLSVMCEGDGDAELDVYLLRDGEEFDASHAVPVGTVSFDNAHHEIKTMSVLTRQFAANFHRVRFVGRGYIKVYALEIKIAWGGEIYET